MEQKLQEEIDLLVKTLDLIPHPEGGFYRETYRSEETIKGGKRCLLTCIYFLLTSENVSHFHRIKSDEHWFYHGGSPLIVHIMDAAGHHEHVVGNNIEKGYLPHFLVPKNTIFGSTVMTKLADGGGYSLVSCAVAPGFDFADFELLTRAELLRHYPMHKEIIELLAIS